MLVCALKALTLVAVASCGIELYYNWEKVEDICTSICDNVCDKVYTYFSACPEEWEENGITVDGKVIPNGWEVLKGGGGQKPKKDENGNLNLDLLAELLRRHVINIDSDVLDMVKESVKNDLSKDSENETVQDYRKDDLLDDSFIEVEYDSEKIGYKNIKYYEPDANPDITLSTPQIMKRVDSDGYVHQYVYLQLKITDTDGITWIAEPSFYEFDSCEESGIAKRPYIYVDKINDTTTAKYDFLKFSSISRHKDIRMHKYIDGEYANEYCTLYELFSAIYINQLQYNTQIASIESNIPLFKDGSHYYTPSYDPKWVWNDTSGIKESLDMIAFAFVDMYLDWHKAFKYALNYNNKLLSLPADDADFLDNAVNSINPIGDTDLDAEILPELIEGVDTAIQTELNPDYEPVANPAVQPEELPDDLPDIIGDYVAITVPEYVPDPAPDVDPTPDIDPTPDMIINPIPDIDPIETDNTNIKDVTDESIGLTEVFPFCVPFDLIRLISLFQSTAKAPYFEIPFYIKMIDFEYTFVLDFSQFDSLAQVVRVFTLLFFCLGLVTATRSLIKG